MKRCATSLAIRRMQAKTTLASTSHLLEWLLSIHVITSIGKDLTWTLSCIFLFLILDQSFILLYNKITFSSPTYLAKLLPFIIVQFLWNLSTVILRYSLALGLVKPCTHYILMRKKHFGTWRLLGTCCAW